MLAHLLSLESEPLPSAASSFVPEEMAPPAQLLAGKVNTADWLQNLDALESPSQNPAYQKALAAPAFAAGTGTDQRTIAQQRASVLALKTPEAVKRAVSMLTAYEWQFVEQAQNIRSYIVTGLLEETQNPKAEVRLKAFKLLGDVTEVGLFTHRTEVVTRDLSDEQIENEIRARLERITIDQDTPVLTRVDNDVDD